MSDPSTTASGQSNQYLQRAYKLKDADEARDLYDEWATSYDHDLRASDYESPQRTVDAVVANISDIAGTIKILDAGCGTGLVGECFASSKLAGRCTVDGKDLSNSMVEVARAKGVYRDLEVANLNERLNHADGSYHVVTCTGTLTKGHVGATVFKEFARVTSMGGIIVATVHDEIFESNGYQSEVKSLAARNVMEIVSTDDFGIVKGQTKGGRMVVLRKL
ncbi:S-adenosyl-L-methionine-dependent methyltransferase [Neohortaea acidophila]|uniref:S-adenosyl-L-methionine-dependent methyltransferase n=1 Tax=Neohortaea acidophila TaxID=245834 RepID=A0A6A6Q6E5_9PEZI|nr:S-adenosyl-L-methionine-dependent methyltransferase [Neohortaea acidophila]KAF2487885.1 S-adenosyl-L-methionine-dependent methyltransferase [Neohortaea acidophila]